MVIPVKWFATGGLSLALLIALGWTVGRGQPVLVATVSRQAIVQSIVATGRVNPVLRVDLGAEVAGTVAEVYVREGQRVRAGDLLVRLSDAEARASLQQARSALAEARVRQAQQVGVSAPVAWQAASQAQATYVAAGRDHQRVHELVAQGFYPQQKLDDAQRALTIARSAWLATLVQAEANQPQGVEPVLLAARIDQAQAALQMAQARLARLALRSPADALVLSRQVEPGSMAQPGRVLLSLAGAQGLRLDTSIDEKYLHLLTLGMRAQAVADAFPAQRFAAQLSYVAPAVDPQRGAVDVRLAVPEPPAFLRPDMTVSIELLGGTRASALVLPAGAVRDADRAAPWVLKIAGGRARRVDVKLGLHGVGAVEITEGLREGDMVIPPTEKAVAGDRVRPAPAAAHARGFEVPSFIR